MASTNKSQPLLSIIFLLFTTLHPLKSSGVTVDLVPRDSPSSPFYNASKTYFDRLHDALERSLTRANHIKSVLSNLGGSKIQTQIISGGGSYLMNVSIGTPPVEVLGIADTGSDLIWTQCLPCTECFEQDLPIFDPNKSSTYKKVSCQSSTCTALEHASCSNDGSTCGYSYSYGDGSQTSGDLSTETLTIGSKNPASFNKIAFGCAHDSSGTFDSSSSGLVGLGGGALSLVSQLDEKKLSYCLLPFSSNASSKISLGRDAVVSGSGTVKTPLVSKSPDTFYYLTLESISVGHTRIAYKGSTVISPDATSDTKGNIIIDSGTTLTYLPTEFYDEVSSAVEKAVGGQTVEGPSGLGLSPCYSASDDLNFPDLTAHFDGGDVNLGSLNTFVRVSEDVVCFSLTQAGSNPPIYGNLAQANFLVGYDLDAGTVSFLPKDCTKP
ncbi:aspartic proteinase CDR1-like [Prosopis cineraria]|uniref:aspartic proteinase CDR1-like n=1 Tax=Prosopis cineraria TaxID=364024 RepID=UPI0024108500|nr:aspartic proteinase CDR1-like [Prosopis cineraria]